MTCVYLKLLINTRLCSVTMTRKVTLASLFSAVCLLVCYLFSNLLTCHIHVCVCGSPRVIVCSACLLNVLSLRSREHNWTGSQIKIVYVSFYNLVSKRWNKMTFYQRMSQTEMFRKSRPQSERGLFLFIIYEACRQV